MQGLNRQETEDYIIDLYQKKTFREIQKIVRKSPRDIRAILDKGELLFQNLQELIKCLEMDVI
jgi:polyhydroxyalkanoate synthesis regulator phasin